MSLLSLSYILFLIIGMIVYYSIPKKGQWIVLLLMGVFFYAQNTPKGSVFLLFSMVTAFLYGWYCDKLQDSKLQVRKLQGRTLEGSKQQRSNIQKSKQQCSDIQKSKQQRSNIQESKQQRSNVQESKQQHSNIQKSKQQDSNIQSDILRESQLQDEEKNISQEASGLSETESQQQAQRKKKWMLVLTISLNVLILLVLKVFLKIPFVSGYVGQRLGMLIPLGISFYTLQIIAYMVDVYRGKIQPEKNLFRFALFVSFFPQILQGPIPRYDKLAPQFEKAHKFDYILFTDSLMLMLWGYFQKMVIADNAAIVVNRVFGEYQTYQGFYVVLAAFLYSIQLYADFSGCVNIARGSAGLFGIQLEDNFNHPYFSHSIKEFWGRWHISLSSFLKDYIYIPLGGNRKGKIRKYINLLLTFLVSGIWHGAGLTFLVWGFLHGMYQIIEDICKPWLTKLMNKLHINMENFSFRFMLQIKTFVLAAVAWIFFRADSIKQALSMLKSIITGWNPYVLFDESFYLLGLNGKEFRMLILSIGILWLVSFLQERMKLRETFRKQNLLFQWSILLLGIFAVLIFGVYGPGYDATQFIYGNF